MPFLDLVLDLPLDTSGWSTLEIVTYLALQVPRVINISFLLTISMYSWGERSITRINKMITYRKTVDLYINSLYSFFNPFTAGVLDGVL